MVREKGKVFMANSKHEPLYPHLCSAEEERRLVIHLTEKKHNTPTNIDTVRT